MNFSYPYEVSREGRVSIIRFPDVPGAATQAEPGEDIAELARDCLITALGSHAELRRLPPQPSAARGREVVDLGVLLSAKLVLLDAMLEQDVSNLELARSLGVDEKIVRRLLDPDHASRIDRLEEALHMLGCRLRITASRQERHPGRKDREPRLAPTRQ